MKICALILESRIQLAVREAFGMSYYTESGAQSWLGRVEVRDPERLSSVRFEFDELPDVEPYRSLSAPYLASESHKRDYQRGSTLTNTIHAVPTSTTSHATCQ